MILAAGKNQDKRKIIYYDLVQHSRSEPRTPPGQLRGSSGADQGQLGGRSGVDQGQLGGSSVRKTIQNRLPEGPGDRNQ